MPGVTPGEFARLTRKLLTSDPCSLVFVPSHSTLPFRKSADIAVWITGPICALSKDER